MARNTRSSGAPTGEAIRLDAMPATTRSAPSSRARLMAVMLATASCAPTRDVGPIRGQDSLGAGRRQGRGRRAMKPSLVMVGLALVLCGALVWRGDQWGQQSRSALAQAPADHPAAFSGSLVDQRASWPVSIRQVAYVPAYSSIRLGSGKSKLDLATTL